MVLGGADFSCGAYAAGFLDAGDTAIVTGTWEIVVVCSDRPQLGPALRESGAICDVHVVPERWSTRIENLSGDVTEWYRRLITEQRAAFSADGDMGWQPLIESAEAADAGSNGVIFVPHVFGSYGPRHDRLARGAFVGLSGPCGRAELTRAVFEGLSFQTRHALEALTSGIGTPPHRVVTMGGDKEPFLGAEQSGHPGRELEVVTTPDVTPRGAAMIAGIGVGLFRDFREAADRFAQPSTRCCPTSN